METDFKEFVYYDETSPTFLRWKVDVYSGRYYRILEKAKQMAIDFRKEKELELNLVGVAFTERHGK